MITIQSKDSVLARMTDYINGTDKELPITLVLPGLLVSGKLVSGHRFMQQLMDKTIIAQTFRNLVDERNKHLEIDFDIFKEYYSEQSKSVSDYVNYIHMMDARFHNGSGKDLSRRPAQLWRGSLEHVVGFYLD